MNCQSFEEIVNELGRGPTLDQSIQSGLRDDALAHLDDCTECSLRLQDGRALTQRLDELSREMSSVNAPASVEEALRQAFRAGNSRPALSPALPSGAASHRLQFNRWSLSMAAVAALVLLVLGIVSLRFWPARHSPPAPHDSPVVKSSPMESPSIPNQTTGGLPRKTYQGFSGTAARKKPDLHARHAANRKGNQPPQTVANTTITATSDTESEVATQFMPLGYAGPISLQDGAQLVRIEMSRSAMLSLGLPVNMDRYGESVKADVLLGADGFARAIRFVQ